MRGIHLENAVMQIRVKQCNGAKNYPSIKMSHRDLKISRRFITFNI